MSPLLALQSSAIVGANCQFESNSVYEFRKQGCSQVMRHLQIICFLHFSAGAWLLLKNTTPETEEKDLFIVTKYS